MRTAITLFTRDLRVHDNPALATAVRAAEIVVPLFVLDPSIRAGANRARFLTESLTDLRAALRQRGGDLAIRRGDPVAEAMRLARQVGAEGIAIAGDVSPYAHRREARLRTACAEARLSLTVLPGVTVVPPGELRPGGGGTAYQIFTPYWRVWRQALWRKGFPTPRRLAELPPVEPGELPLLAAGTARDRSRNPIRGGEVAGRQRLKAWLGHVGAYPENHDGLAVDRTSRLSAYLRFGCLSPLEVAQSALAAGPAEEFVRQLCWRDFYYQIAAAYPRLTTEPVRPVTEQWRTDPEALSAWQDGRTGIPVVDAGMRQLRAEGFMHNRARLLVGSYLTKHLDLDWREGAAWFGQWLLDGDVPNNYGNWQWVAGTGTDTKPYRRFNPIRQAHRFDPDGDYVRRYVPELSGLEGAAVHEPWKLPPSCRRGYPEPVAGPRPEAWLP